MEQERVKLRELLMAPFMGLAFLIFMPAAAIVATLYVIGSKIFTALTDGFGRAAVFGWRPAESYLVGRRVIKNKKISTNEETQRERQDE